MPKHLRIDRCTHELKVEQVEDDALKVCCDFVMTKGLNDDDALE